jgi:hypothetical protein
VRVPHQEWQVHLARKPLERGQGEKKRGGEAGFSGNWFLSNMRGECVGSEKQQPGTWSN